MQVFDVLTEEMGPIFDDRNVQRNGGNWEYHSHPADPVIWIPIRIPENERHWDS